MILVYLYKNRRKDLERLCGGFSITTKTLKIFYY